MATLTETAFYARKIIKYGSLLLVVFIIVRAGFLSLSAYWKSRHPKPPPPPTVAFGKLPKLKFPLRPDLPALSLKLETVAGTLPTLPNQAKVFFMPESAPNLVAWDNTKAWAQKLGFRNAPEIPDKFSFLFTTDSLPKTTLAVNVLTRNFTLAYDWKNDIQILSHGNPPQESNAINIAKAYLQSADAFPDDLAQGSAEVTFLKFQNGNLSKALFLAEANFAVVNFFRGDINGIKVLPPNSKNSNISIMLASQQENSPTIVEAKYIHFPYSEPNFATYPLRDVNAAWQLLLNGRGFVANLGNNSDGKIIIRNAYLAYFDSDEPQNFLQPVIVFEGDNDFFAYVPAITDEWLGQ